MSFTIKIVFLLALIPPLVSAADAAEVQGILTMVGVIVASCCACLCLIDSRWARDPEVSTKHRFFLSRPSVISCASSLYIAADPDVGNQPGE